MKTYISGPLAGLPELSREEKVARFKRAAEVLKEMGHETLDPNDLTADCDAQHWGDGCGDTNGHSWACWLRFDLIGMLQECDQIALLPGWKTSKGASLELDIAMKLDWPVIDLSDNEYVLNAPTEEMDEQS